MKYLEGIIYILIGLCFTLLRVNIINFTELRGLMSLPLEYVEVSISNGVYEPLSYSLIPIVIGLLFILLGTIKIREVIISAK